jgi:DNA (cytosine-5)-methyltransferase 1
MSGRSEAVAVDLFCGAGGLTRGLLDAGLKVVAGYDIDAACQYPYEVNNSPAAFVQKSVSEIVGSELRGLYPSAAIKILVGCAPCQPFSKYTQGEKCPDKEKWGLLNHFSRLITEVKPQLVSMENVVQLRKHRVYSEFMQTLEDAGYYVSAFEVFCPDYGIPQQRLRLVVFASTFGPVAIVPPTHKPQHYVSVRDAIGRLPALRAGEACETDEMHRACRLSSQNLERLGSSKPGGTWRDWPKNLVAACHRKKKGKTYPSVYGRMSWDKPSPTITTQFYGFGNGRFGHPEQDRAISLREGAVLQSFPETYRFVAPDQRHSTKQIGRLIGNAVPVRLGKVVGLTLLKHIALNLDRHASPTAKSSN